MGETVKGLITAAVSLLLAVLEPTTPIAICAVLFWGMNFFVGIWKAKHCGEEFSGKKAFRAFQLMFVVSGILVSIAIFGFLMKAGHSQIVYASKAVGIAFIYYLVLNINKNLIYLFPEEKLFKTLDYWLKIEIIKTFTFLKVNNETKERNNTVCENSSEGV